MTKDFGNVLGFFPPSVKTQHKKKNLTTFCFPPSLPVLLLSLCLVSNLRQVRLCPEVTHFQSRGIPDLCHLPDITSKEQTYFCWSRLMGKPFMVKVWVQGPCFFWGPFPDLWRQRPKGVQWACVATVTGIKWTSSQSLRSMGPEDICSWF